MCTDGGKAILDIAGEISFLKEPAWAAGGSGVQLSVASFEVLVLHIRHT